MTLRILKSAVVDALIADFIAEVDRFAKDRRDWIAHMAFVDAERNFPLKKPEMASYESADGFAATLKEYNAALAQRHWPYPAPIGRPSVMAAVTDRGEVDFEIIDDLRGHRTARKPASVARRADDPAAREGRGTRRVPRFCLIHSVQYGGACHMAIASSEVSLGLERSENQSREPDASQDDLEMLTQRCCLRLARVGEAESASLQAFLAQAENLQHPSMQCALSSLYSIGEKVPTKPSDAPSLPSPRLSELPSGTV